jgi:hypothetical protein
MVLWKWGNALWPTKLRLARINFAVRAFNRGLCTFWKEAFFEQINTKKRTPVNDAFDCDSQNKTQDAEVFEQSLDWQEKQDRLIARYVGIAPPAYVPIPDKECKERSN